MIQNPKAEYGATWFWNTPATTTALTLGTPASGEVYGGFVIKSTVTGAVTVYSDWMPLTAGQYAGGRYEQRTTTQGNLTARLEYGRADKTSLGFGSPSAASTTVGPKYILAAQAPANTALVRMVFTYNATGTTGQTAFTEVMVTKANTAGVIPNIPLYVEPITWQDITGSTYQIESDREAFQPGTLSASIKSDTLDPAIAETITIGKRLRLNFVGTYAHPVWTGKVTEASVTYNDKVADIKIEAVDAMADLAGQTEARGVATINDLAYLLEGKGAPWYLSTSGGNQPAGTPAVVNMNENASVLDQVAITRDTNRAYAWMDRNGVLRISEASALPSTPYETFSDAAGASFSYTDIDTSWSTTECINHVTVKFLRYNAGTGQTEEVPYGPFVNQTSIDKYGARAAEFTIGGTPQQDNNAFAQAYANAVLAANATPVVRANSMKYRVKQGVAAYAYSIDLYTMLRVIKTGRVDSNVRVTGIKHSITPEAWDVEYTFGSTGSVAPPTATPTPPEIGAVVSGKAWQVRCNAGVNVTTTSYVSVPGLQQYVTVASPDEQFLVTVTMDLTRTGAAAVFTGSFWLDSTVQTGQVIYFPSATGHRETVAQTWIVSGMQPGSRQFSVLANLTGAGAYTVSTTHTNMSIVRL